jgi:hypothetical protein
LSFDTRTGSPEEEKVAVIWDILPAVRDATKGNIISPYKLMPHVSFKISGDKAVKYEVESQ